MLQNWRPINVSRDRFLLVCALQPNSYSYFLNNQSCFLPSWDCENKLRKMFLYLNEPDWHSSDLHMSICTARIGSIFHLLIEFINVLGTRVPQSPFFITWPNPNFLSDPAGPACSLLQRQFLCLDSSYNREVNVIFSFINFFMRNIMRI